MRDSGPNRWLALAGAAVLLVTACTSSATPSPAPSAAPTAAPAATAAASAAAGPEAARAKVCTAAKTEGKLVYWNTFSSPDKVVAAFQKAYPGIEVDVLSNHPDDLVQGLLTELAAGRRPTADILYGELNILRSVEAVKGINTTIDWKALGVKAEILTSFANVVRLFRVAMGLSYNTRVTKVADLPATWSGLLNQQWKGQIVADPRGRPFDQLAIPFGRDYMLGYVRQLKALNPIIIRGGTAGILAVASEQAKIATGGRSAETFEQKAKGSPIEIKYLEIIPTIDSYNMVTAGAQHPNAAACMVSWLATDGQAIHDEIEFKSNITIPTGAPAEAKYAIVDNAFNAELVQSAGKQFGDILTGITK